VANVTFTGTGSSARISPDPKTASSNSNAGERIPVDPVDAGLGAHGMISPDPTTASGQTITLKP